jgi:hypothetical protein
MRDAKKRASREDIATRARRLRTLRRVKRLDILVAMALLLLLIFGWAVDFAPLAYWPGGHFLTASRSPHA